jgi:hypothetical protein
VSFQRGFKAWCENVALQVRRDLELVPTAALDPRRLASHLEIEVRTPYDIPGLDRACLRRLVNEDPESWSAVTLSSGDKDLIVLNPVHSRGRQASDLMHELAHILLGHDPARVDVAENGSLVLFTYDKDQEDEANWLAACLLLPRAALLLIRRASGDLKSAAKDYGVSQVMLQYRLNVTGVEHQLRRTTRRVAHRRHAPRPKTAGD